ncbi:hypothetical protein [Halogranum rubrum]|uniref:Uncharacterized protein n=1 Tax=Halogranum salarium B-1 TaxID=1210908 RepID=J3EZ35_9EURY|nr:hypothetical protein [Halogranum salarium]EJN60747.1 hypothetical protein HSB1_13500 [Halogranum salarium B-1]
MSTTPLLNVVQLFSSADDGDTDIVNAVMSGEMDLPSAIEALAELDDAELKKQLLSAAVVGGFTLIDRKRKSRSGASESADSDESDDTEASVEADDEESITVDVDEDEEEADEESSSRLVTLPRLAFLGVAAGVTYAVVKYRQSGADDTAQSTFDDVDDGGHQAGLAVDDEAEEEDAETEEVLAEDDVVEEADDDEAVDEGSSDEDGDSDEDDENDES